MSDHHTHLVELVQQAIDADIADKVTLDKMFAVDVIKRLWTENPMFSPLGQIRPEEIRITLYAVLCQRLFEILTEEHPKGAIDLFARLQGVLDCAIGDKLAELLLHVMPTKEVH